MSRWKIVSAGAPFIEQSEYPRQFLKAKRIRSIAGVLWDDIPVMDAGVTLLGRVAGDAIADELGGEYLVCIREGITIHDFEWEEWVSPFV